MRAVLAAEEAGDEDAALAMAVYLHRLRAGIASMAAAMDGIDAMVFTGGVGERSAPVRQRAAEGLGSSASNWTWRPTNRPALTRR